MDEFLRCKPFIGLSAVNRLLGGEFVDGSSKNGERWFIGVISTLPGVASRSSLLIN